MVEIILILEQLQHLQLVQQLNILQLHLVIVHPQVSKTRQLMVVMIVILIPVVPAVVVIIVVTAVPVPITVVMEVILHHIAQVILH